MEQARYSDLKYLTVKLPEDIEKLKWYGDFERAQKVIDMRLQKDIPKALRRRLELEKWILKRLCRDILFRHMKNILINLLRRLTV